MFQKDQGDISKQAHEVFLGMAAETEQVTARYRKSFIRRFPIIFGLCVAFGLVTTFYGFERIIEEISWLYERPLLILVVGIGTLAITGSLAKKLR